MNSSHQKIVVIVSGGIAAYKSAELVSRLRKTGAAVRVVMTRGAREFVAPLTFETLSGHPVYEEVFERPASYEMEHISWARWADAVVVVPATANLLAKMALGLADDAASTLLLAYEGPVWIAPAMNTAMWNHPATRQNMETLRGRGVQVVEPGSGLLACGDMGAGRMAEPEQIVAQVLGELAALKAGEGSGNGAAAPEEAADRPLAGKTVLVTGGPTREMLDPIRFISNRSTGKMAAALATQARELGARVILVHGPMSAPIPAGVEAVAVTGAREMLAAVQARWEEVDLAVFAAAVANYEAGEQSGQKIKGAESLTLTLYRTPDIAAWCGHHRRPGQVLVGFAAESENLLEYAARKLEQKNLDLICANDIAQPGAGFESEGNQVTLMGRGGWQVQSALLPKNQVAAWIWTQTLAAAEAGRTLATQAAARQ